MPSKFDKYKVDFDELSKKSNLLQESLNYECYGQEYKDTVLESCYGDKEKAKAHLLSLPSFKTNYQEWYSEALSLIKQLLPDRLADFIRHYEKPKNRKNISYENYRIEDALQGLLITRNGHEVIADSKAAIPHFKQQVAILDSLKVRFNSSLFDIKQLVQADVLDSELDSASLLSKHKFFRAAGAVAGVVLEKHLAEVCSQHGISIRKKYPTIADLNETLKSEAIISTPQWRFNQHLADIRNLCDHNKDKEPTKEDVDGMIEGVTKVIKTVF